MAAGLSIISSPMRIVRCWCGRLVQMRAFEERFLMLRIVSSVIGGPRFFERARSARRSRVSAADPLSRQDDDLAFERIVNQPKRGVGDATIEELHRHARKSQTSLMQAARLLLETDELKPKVRAALRDLDGWLCSMDRHARKLDILITSLPRSCSRNPATPTCGRRIARPNAAGRLENLKELVRIDGGVSGLCAPFSSTSLW